MSDLRDLYQEVILDHSRSPRNFGHHEPSNREAKGNNPLCGDKFTIYALVEDGIVKDVSFEGRGCAISTASASLMSTSSETGLEVATLPAASKAFAVQI